MNIRIVTGLMTIGLALAGCAPQATRPDVVQNQIGQELQQALTDRKRSDSADKALLPPLTAELPSGVVEGEPRFDLSVVSAPAVQVFMAIVNGTRYNMLVGPEVTGNITVNLKDVTVKDALEAIRDLYGYEYQIRGNRIRIEPNTLQTRMFQVNYLASRRQGMTNLRVTSSSIATNPIGSGANTGYGNTATSLPLGTTPPPGTGTGAYGTAATTTSQVQTSSDADFWKDLNSALTMLMGDGEGRKVVINPISGVIVVRALPREIRAVDNYLKATQIVVDRQVMLEAKIIEVTLKDQYQAGVNWGAFGADANGAGAIGAIDGATANALAQGGNLNKLLANSSISKTGFFGLAFKTANFAALLNFLDTQGNTQVLSSPRIATINNQKAVLKVGTDDLFVTNVTTNTTSTTTGTVSTPSLTLQSYFSGISLDVTPQIDEDNNIILHVHPAVSVVTEKEKTIDLGVTLGQFKLPLASSSVNETDSIVRVQDGNIVAIGGLMKQAQTSDRSGLPGTTNSAAGVLVGQRGSSLTKQELVILIKPTVISDDRAWVRDLEQTGQRVNSVATQSSVLQGQ